MAGNVAAKLPKGATFSFDASDSGTFTTVSGIEILPATSNSSEPKEKTTLEDTRKVYGVGLKDSPDMAIALIYLPDDEDQAAFVTACAAQTEISIRIDIPDVDERREFLFQPFGVDDDALNPAEFTKINIPGKQNSDVVRTSPIPAV